MELYHYLEKYMKENNIERIDIKGSMSVTGETLNLIVDYEHVL